MSELDRDREAWSTLAHDVYNAVSEHLTTPRPALDLPEVTRVCVVTEVERRVLDMRDAYPHGCQVHIMDEGRTIKILPRQETSND